MSFLTILLLIIKRMLSNSYLMLATLLGLLISASMVSAIPLFTQGSLERLLHQELTNSNPELLAQRLRQELSKPIRSSLEQSLREELKRSARQPVGTITIQNFQGRGDLEVNARYPDFNSYLIDNIEPIIDLPIRQFVRFLSTQYEGVWPEDMPWEQASRLRRHLYLAFHTDLSKHIQIIDGVDLPDRLAGPDEDIPVIITSHTAETQHLNLGERYLFTDYDGVVPNEEARAKLPGVRLKIVGIWEPVDPESDFWMYDPQEFDDVFFLNEANISRVFDELPVTANEFGWYAIADTDAIHMDKVDRILAGIRYLQSKTVETFPSARYNLNFFFTLEDFNSRALILNTLLFVISIPTLVVVFYYVTIAMAMIVDRQRNEIALLKSRGASNAQLFSIYLGEGLIMGGISLGIGPLIGFGLAKVMGNAYGFLLFAQRPPLTISFDSATWTYTAVAVAMTVTVAVAPVIGAARHNIITYKQEIGRSIRRPLHEVFFIDFLLLAAAGYGYRLLQQKESFIVITSDRQLVVDVTLLVVPALFIMGASLLLLRVFPYLTAGLAKLVSIVGGASTLLALRQISRTPGQYRTLVLLLTLTVGFGTYSASAARTIETNQVDQVRYDIPADLELRESTILLDQGVYITPDFGDHFVPGVVDATMFTSYIVILPVQGRPPAILLAIDRSSFPQVAWWRPDFADKPLGALMNALGADPSAVIVSRKLLQKYGYKLGDQINLGLREVEIPFYITEVVDYFPTLYPGKELFIIANIDYLRDWARIDGYGVWMNVSPDRPTADIISDIRKHQLEIYNIRDSRIELTVNRLDPQLTGMFGMLSIGFIVAGLLTVLGFFLYSYLSFQKRIVQMGILRAMGLSARQLFAMLMAEQLYLIVLGVLSGIALGLLAGSLYIPFLQFGVKAEGDITPPFIVATPWGEFGRIFMVIGAMVLAGLVFISFMLRRLQLFRAVKLGEEQ